MSIPVITLDGPSGAGKGTLGMRLAVQLGWHYLDSGALYRIVAHQVQQDQALGAHDSPALLAMIDRMKVAFKVNAAADACHVWVNGDEVTRAIRTEACGQLASQLAALPAVRQHLHHLQCAFCQSPGLVADGRDMGTVVFPHAPHKFFIDASCAQRAKRRWLQLQHNGQQPSYAAVLADLEKRDRRDRQRTVAPLVPADDALVLDTTEMDIEAVVAWVSERL